MSSTIPPAAATNTQIVEERVIAAASSAVSRPTQVVTSSAVAGYNGGSAGGRSANVSGGEVVIEFNSRITSHYHQQPSENYAWGMLAGFSGLTAVVSLALLIGGLLNRDGFQPAWATICFWSSSLFVFANRQRTSAVNGLDLSLERADEPRALDKASRQALLKYFVFNPSEDNQGDDNSCISTTPVVPAKSADVTSPPDDLEAQVTPVLTYSTEDESINAERVGLSTPAGNIVERELSRTGSSKWVTNGTCIICLGEYKSGERLCRMPCRHVYHAKCIDEWLDRANKPSCPLCKKDLRGEVAAASSSANTAARPSEGTLLDTSGIGVA